MGIMGMLKSPAFRATTDIPADLRTYIWMRLDTITVSQLAAYYYPRMMALHNLPADVGVPNEKKCITIPDMLNLTRESMSMDGVYLLDAGFLQAVFGAPSFEQMDSVQAETTLGTRPDP